MEKLTDEPMRIASADGELRLDASGKTAEELLNLAVKTGKSSQKLVITNVSKMERVLLERLAIAGKGNVLFDLR